MYIHRDERSKFDSKVKQCIFIGYGHEEFGFKLWDLVNNRGVKIVTVSDFC